MTFIGTMILIIDEFIIESLLDDDKFRADLVPYHQKMLEDTELGHWSLWPTEQEESGMRTLELKNKLVARDPNSNINNGVVGIDFGTKSTVVVYQKDNVNIHPMRIGTGDLSSPVIFDQRKGRKFRISSELSSFKVCVTIFGSLLVFQLCIFRLSFKRK